MVPPLIMNAEGGTTNGEYLIKFKKGAFVGLKSIMPVVHKYHSYFQSPTSGIIEGMPHHMLTACIPWSTCTRTELPVFRPNNFFFENYQLEHEEKWQTYERIIRQIIAESGDFILSDAVIEDKFKYKMELYPGKYKHKVC